MESTNHCTIFISYRRTGGEFIAHLLYERLSQLGYSVFLDIETLRSGRFNEALYDRIEECDDFILILSENALDRCSNSEDWVRLEIESAIQKKKNIVPIMLRGFEFPVDLPDSISEVKYYNGIPASSDTFDSAIQKLTGRFLVSRPVEIHIKGLSDFERGQVLKCHLMIKQYLRSDNIEDPDEYSKLVVELEDVQPFLPAHIYSTIHSFVEEHIGAITERYSELFIEPMLEKGIGCINDNGVYSLRSGEEAEQMVAHFYKTIFDIEAQYDSMIRGILGDVI